MQKITWARVVTFEENGHRFHYASARGAGDRWARIDGPNCTNAVARVLAARSINHQLADLRAHYKQQGEVS